MDVFDISKKNKINIIAYLIILSITSISYYLMVSLRVDGYNPSLYKYAYIYFNGFSMLLFTLIMLFWDINYTYINIYLKIIIESLIASLSAVPIILIIFMLGQLNKVNIFIPLIIQSLWGTVILSIKNISNKYKNKNFFIGMFIFITIVLSSVYLFFYTNYANIVLTTIYDKDIPIIFFLNPLINIVGISYSQMIDNQMGYYPVICYLVFWGMVVLIFNILDLKFNKVNSSKEGGQNL
ncbi:hypothetical protein [Tepidibacter hydrothermalis]|uniref:Uncharacterized protein n=1 Tax=Tepidibacter hydrothermalis TaxID=3036126 RepID=A0ABY8ECQ8_9FIRM|nr:hypothetical protein [Tepidibacter hydrothermalis]WFD10697.1 hypothetical protein P4S50_01090 [Tepidibacter hydrothermalis]